jgi:CRP-like cAMP-binding protein
MAMSVVKNALLAQFSEDARASLELKPFHYDVNHSIYLANQPAESVYFVESGVISVVGDLADGRTIEVGTIGRESMAGTFLILGAKSVPFRHFVQIECEGFQTSVATFLKSLESDGEVRGLVGHAEAAFRTQSMQNATCNGMHNVEQRCCRWILMTRDRVD